MQIKGKIPLFIVAVLAWIVIISSCANQGMPIGGPKDSIPPVLIETKPEFKELNYDEDEVEFTFDEYIIPDAVSEALVVSPPLSKRPLVRTKGKSLIIKFNEELLDSTTYSLDLKNSVVDNNESNPYENLRFSFSTGDIFDSLRIAGRLMNAFDLEPVESGLVLLQSNLHDSAVFRVRPDYIAKTDETGLFMIDNIRPGKYHVFALNDANNDLLYNEGAEEISFMDSVIIPYAEYHEEIDTLVKGVDSLMVMGHTHFHPDPLYLRQFMEDIFDQYLDSYSRDTRYKCTFIFNESVKDTFSVNLIGMEESNWFQLEHNEDMDSLVLWIADTTIARIDSIEMEISYYQLDTANQLYVIKDTIDMFYVEKEKQETRKRRREKKDEDEEDEPEPIQQFDWQTNIKSSGFDLNQAILLTAPEPVQYFDSTKIILYLTEDTLKTPLSFNFEKDTIEWRRYKIAHDWESETGYTLEIDSASCTNIFGITSRQMIKKFTTQEEDYYGSIIVKLTNVSCPVLVQVLKNTDEENIVAQLKTEKDGSLIFNYMKPEKYRIKVIYDENDNGKWDTGSYQDKNQPERVTYINEIHKVRSNWSEEISWNLKFDYAFTKNIRDLEEEERLRKEAEEKARRERENPQRERFQDDSFQGGTSGGANIIRR